MSTLNQRLADFDPAIAEAIGLELARQRTGLEMIASENHAPVAVMEAQGSVLTNKYAEGYPGRRYYGARTSRVIDPHIEPASRLLENPPLRASALAFPFRRSL